MVIGAQDEAIAGIIRASLLMRDNVSGVEKLWHAHITDSTAITIALEDAELETAAAPAALS
jgi:hypothetical protein